MIHGSIFDDVRDNAPWAIPPVTFADLVSALVDTAVECEPAAKAEQKCISPAIYGPGETRCKAGAQAWDWFAADIDNKLGNFPGSTIDEMIAVMRGLGSPWFIYTTASSQPSAECFRLMFPLDRPVLNAEFDIVWQAFSRLLPMDPQTKDISRLFIVPRQWTGRPNRVEYELEGTPVVVNDILRQFPPRQPVRPTPVSSGPAAAPSAGQHNFGSAVLPSLDAPYVSQQAVSKALGDPPGGRMYRFLLSVAFQALRTGYNIGPEDLKEIGDELSGMMGRGRDDIYRDAQSAHRYAAQHYIEGRDERFNRIRGVLRPKGLNLR